MSTNPLSTSGSLSYPANRFISTIFLDPIYICINIQYSFFFFTYFTLYNRLRVYPLNFNWLRSIPFHVWVMFHCIHVQFSCSVMSTSLQTHGLQHVRLPCPTPTPGVCSNSCPLSQRCHPTILSSVVPFPSCLQSFPASGSFPMSQFFESGGQSTRASASASVHLMNIQDW